jgi:tetratricopeptide (TPR) repeat protein
MFMSSLKSACRVTLLFALALWGGAPCASAVLDPRAGSSLEFFERMGTVAPAAAQIDEAQAVGKPALPGQADAADEVAGVADQLGSEVAQLVGPDLVSTQPKAVAADAEAVAVLPGPDEQLLEAALQFYHGMDYMSAISALVKVLNFEGVRPEVEKSALIYIARIYYQLNMPLRTIGLLELYADSYPDDPRREEVIFQTGILHREVGQYEPAIAAFYRVLNAIIMAGEDGMEAYLKLARRAQFEIARTHFALGEWAQALDLFNRIVLLELAPQDRETLRFYKAKALVYAGERGKGLREIDRFIEAYPNSSFIAELRYEKARAQIEMKEIDAGRQTLMGLIEMGGVPEENMTSEWVEWRRVAGNFLANYYFKSAEYETALRLYQALVVMDSAPQWQLPIVLQMASCFRELGRYERAADSLQFVIQEIDVMRENSGVDKLSGEFEFLADSASWQLGLLNWHTDFIQRLEDDA